VMDPANRNGELVAHSVSKRTRLGKREVKPQQKKLALFEATNRTHCQMDGSATESSNKINRSGNRLTFFFPPSSLTHGCDPLAIVPCHRSGTSAF
jgi:hypothetical protein